MDIQELNKQLTILQQNMARQKKLNAMLANAENNKGILVHELGRLKTVLEKEDADLIKVEGKTLTALLYAVLGTLDKHIEKEKQEAIIAKLKYDRAQKHLQEVEERIGLLTAECNTYTDCTEQYEDLLALKKQVLMVQNSKDIKCILKLENKINAANIIIKEVDEVKIAGEEAIKALNLALDRLNSAERLSIWDFFGGGMIANVMKHDRINDAVYFIIAAQNQLEKFKEEMCDVNINIDISGSLYLTDIFFDNIFTDYTVHSRINDAQDSVSEALSKITSVLDKFKMMQSEVERKLGEYKNSLEKLITTG